MALPVEEAVLLLCDRVIRDAKSRKAVLDGVFDRVLVPSYPGGLNCALYFRFYINGTSLSQVPIRLAIHGPKGEVEQLPGFSVGVQPGDRVEGVANFESLPIPTAGRYIIALSTGDVEVGRVRFEAISSGGPHGGAE